MAAAESDTTTHLLAKTDDALAYARRRRATFRRWATCIKLTTLAMSAAATIILGLVELTTPVAVAFVLTALVTLLSALEPYFNFRARWVLMEEGQHEFHRIKDDIEFAVAKAGGRLPPGEVDGYHRRLSEIWTYLSESWLDERRRSDQG
jgi:hypothetical protein